MIERLNREMKRRIRVASLFPNEASLFRLVSAILMEVSEEWEIKKTCEIGVRSTPKLNLQEKSCPIPKSYLCRIVSRRAPASLPFAFFSKSLISERAGAP